MPPLLWIRESPVYFPFTSEYAAIDAQAVGRSSVASLAFLVWDVLITSDDEVHYIWPRSWSLMKCVYFFVRYMPILIQISLIFVGSDLTPNFHFTPHDCMIWGAYQAIAAGAVVVIVDIILILRVDALYHGDRRIRWVVAVAYVMEITGILVGMILSGPRVTYDNSCLVTTMPEALIIDMSSTIIFQMFLFCLTLYKFTQAARRGWGNIQLITLLMRDGTWAFFLLFLMYIVQLSFFNLKNSVFAGVLYAPKLTLYFNPFKGYRILFNMARFVPGTPNKALGAIANNRATTTESRVSDIRFSIRRQDHTLGAITSDEQSYSSSFSE